MSDWTEAQSESVADAIEMAMDALMPSFPDVDISATRQVLTVTLWGWGERENHLASDEECEGQLRLTVGEVVVPLWFKIGDNDPEPLTHADLRRLITTAEMKPGPPRPYPPVKVEDIAGIDPDFTGDETAEEYLRRRRS